MAERPAWVMWRTGSSWNAARTNPLTAAEADAGGVTTMCAVSECDLAGLIIAQERISQAAQRGQPG
jgi:hypothetical protein